MTVKKPPMRKKRGRPVKISIPALVAELETKAKQLDEIGDSDSLHASAIYYGRAEGLRYVGTYLKTGEWPDD